MSSVTNPGMNYMGGNPLGSKVRALEVTVETLRKQMDALVRRVEAGGASSSAPAAVVAGQPGPQGPPGPPGPPGPAGPMAYIAMPAGMMASVPTPVAASAPTSTD